MTRHLVIQLARFGDLIQTKRLMLSLAASHGEKGKDAPEVHLVVDRSLVALAKILYPYAVVHGIYAHGGAADPATVLTENRAVFAELGAVSFRSVYSLNFSELSFIIAGLFDPAIVRGYKRVGGQNLRSLWNRMAFRWTGERRVSPINLVDFWAHCAPFPIAPEAVNPPAAARGAQRIGVVLAGREARRSLPPSVLASCVEAVFAGMGGPEVVLVGSASERPLARQLLRRFPRALFDRTRDMSGQTAMADLPDLFSGLDALISPDTGTMHLAAHLGVPVRAFFLSSAWAFETGPYGVGHRIWQAVRECAPCVETAPCPHAVACLAPFGDPSFLRVLANKEAATWPDGLVELEPAFDALGQDYHPARGTLGSNARRVAFRHALAAVRGVAEEGAERSLVEKLVHESDWMLPQF